MIMRSTFAELAALDSRVLARLRTAGAAGLLTTEVQRAFKDDLPYHKVAGALKRVAATGQARYEVTGQRAWRWYISEHRDAPAPATVEKATGKPEIGDTVWFFATPGGALKAGIITGVHEHMARPTLWDAVPTSGEACVLTRADFEMAPDNFIAQLRNEADKLRQTLVDCGSETQPEE